MSSNEEKSMMKRSDFAQKLLNDLRIRKEQLSISHNCQATGNYAYSKRGFKGLEVTREKTTTFQDFSFGGSQSNQIVPYGRGRTMEKIDLSKALAFALENVGKATKADPSGNASIISFLHEVGKKSLGYETSERRSSQQQSSLNSQQLPMIHVHIKEISKGAQKLNQIIKACRSGLSIRKGRYSIQCREELMEGAIELEQSLRLLVDIQQASEYTTNKQSNNRIMLLEENDDDSKEDAPNQKYHKIREGAKSDIKMRLLELQYPHNKSNTHITRTSGYKDNSQRSVNPQKGRIPNVVAKLMGLGEFPKVEKETKSTNDAFMKSAENSTRRRVVQASENLVEFNAERNTTTLDLVIRKETQEGNGINYKAKSEDNSRKRNKVSYKDGERMKKNVIKRTLSPTEDKSNRRKFVTRSYNKISVDKKLILHNSDGGCKKKSVQEEKSQGERQHENGMITNHCPKPFTSVEIQMKLPHTVTHKVKPLRKSIYGVEVEKNEMHKPKILAKKNQDISNTKRRLCKVAEPTEYQKPNSKEDDKLIISYQDSNQMKTEVETCFDTSDVPGVEVKSSNKSLVKHKSEVKDDSILLITTNRFQCQAPQDIGLMFMNGREQQSPIPKCDENSERLPTMLKGTNKGDMEDDLHLLEKRQETTEKMSEMEINLTNIVLKSQAFIDTIEALFKLKIPLNVLHNVGESNYDQEDKNLILDCGYELMKRKGRFQELSVHPFVKVPISSSKVNSLNHLVRQLSNEFEKLRAYNRECYTGSLVEDYLPKMLETDVNHKDPNLNSMWDMGWSDLMFAFIEKDDVIRDIEREVFSKLMDEITRDLICI